MPAELSVESGVSGPAVPAGTLLLVGMVAVLAFAGGHVLLGGRHGGAAAPLADPFQIVVNEKKETIRLNRATGEYWVLRDGVPVKHFDRWGVLNDLLDDKHYTWPATFERGRMEVRLRHDGQRCGVMWRLSAPTEADRRAVLESIQKRGKVEIEFLDGSGVQVWSDWLYPDSVKWVKDGSRDMLEAHSTMPSCTPATYQGIRTCRVWY
jgi:hypothetical protein